MENNETNSASTSDRSWLATVGRFAGAIGVVLLATSLVNVVFGSSDRFVVGKGIVGLCCVVVYAATNYQYFLSRVIGSRSSALFVVTSTTTIVVVALLAAANFLAVENDAEWDLTREGIYTLSDKTTKLLDRLSKDVQVQAFYGSIENGYVLAKDILERYQRRTDKLTFEIIDPQTRPDLVEKYGITSYGARIVVTAGDQEARVKNIGEEELTNAIIKVAEQTNKTVYFLEGHGEADITDGDHAEGYKRIADQIVNEGFTVEPLSLLKGGASEPSDRVVEIVADANEAKIVGGESDAKLEVPVDAGLLIIAGARSRLFAPELGAIERYLNRGGRVLALIDTGIETGLESLLRQWKMELHDDIVVDTNPMNRLMGLGPAAPMIYAAEIDHPVLRSMTTPAVFATVRSMEIVAGGEAGVDTQQLVVTGETAWGETQPRAGTAERGADDHAGPIAVGLVATRSIPSSNASRLSEEGRLVAFGDSDWVSNRYQEMQGNQDLFLNTVNWMAEQEAQISIRPKTRAASQLFLSVEQLGRLQFFSMDIGPALLVALGLGITLNRRQR